jgi:hypothetical protein
MPTKLSDKVAVHPRWGTVHELRKGFQYMLQCGNPFNLIDYQVMTRRKAEKLDKGRLCQSRACVNARK